MLYLNHTLTFKEFMMKKLALLALIIGMFPISMAKCADTENWCGTYIEEEGKGYIRLARADFGIGSSSCIVSEYADRVEKSGATNVGLDFTHNNSMVNKWRKFNNHIIEIRGKFRNGTIDNVRLIRDMGV